MTNPRAFVAWQPVLTDHQAYTFEALAALSGWPLHCMVLRTEDPVRKTQGWLDTQVRSVTRRVMPENLSMVQLWKVMSKDRDAVHLFGSPFEQPRMMRALLIAAIRGMHFYLISEPYSPIEEGYFDDRGSIVNRIKAVLRPLIYRGYSLTVGRRAHGIFAISELSLSQYARAGVPRERLFAFGYFVPPAKNLVMQTTTVADKQSLKVVFVGSLIRRKGVQLLTAAVARLREEGHAVTLDAYGPGLAEGLGFNGASIRHRGVIPFGSAQSTIALYDVLVLPSHYDGWGVVVNEALLAGVPVICSDKVGAKVLVETFGAGAVFRSGSAEALADRLRDALQAPELLRAQRQGACHAAAKSTPAEAAHYLWAVIQRRQGALPPDSPWYSNGNV